MANTKVDIHELAEMLPFERDFVLGKISQVEYDRICKELEEKEAEQWKGIPDKELSDFDYYCKYGMFRGETIEDYM